MVISLDPIEKVLSEADPLLKTILAGMLRRIDHLNEEKSPRQVRLHAADPEA